MLLIQACGVGVLNDTRERPPVWQLDPSEIKAEVTRVRAGADLTPASWPGGGKVAVGLSFDVDAETVWLGSRSHRTASYMSRGEYGVRVGMRRVVDLLAEHDIPASFFIPAMSFELHPELVEMVRSNPRNEFGFHSYVHENPLTLSAEDERAVYEKAMAIFTEHIGKRPVGFRSAAWDLTPATIGIVKDMGFLYDSSMMADDRPYRLTFDGKDSGLVELPVEWILDDWPLFQINWPAQHVAIRNADDVYSIWKEEFDGAYDEGSTFILTMHPQVIGHRYRMKMLDRLIVYMKRRPGVWFATHEEIVRHVLGSPGE